MNTNNNLTPNISRLSQNRQHHQNRQFCQQYLPLFGMLSLYVLSLLTTSCRNIDEPNADYSSWTDSTHSDKSTPNYAIVFEQNKVLRFDISIGSDNWAKMLADLSANLGGSATPQGGGPQGGGPQGGGPQGGGPTGGQNVPVTQNTNSDLDFTPLWVTSQLKFNDKTWYNVGIRFKGNSSLKNLFQDASNNKFSLKLDFDEFEDAYPLLKNQRFYGFKQLNLNNNYQDTSLIREKVVADLFRDFGMVAANTTFCEVYIDKGNGSEYFGIYTLVEEVDDTVLQNQLNENSGNLYKPEGDAATFKNGSFNTAQLYKKNNTTSNDYSDANALYTRLNASSRTSDAATWRSQLEAVFDVDVFLKWLAVTTTIQNWDVYGRMSHNYYLYNKSNKLMWIPWDHNEVFQQGKQGGALPVDLAGFGDDWPLITYIIAQDEYKEKYKTYLKQFINEVFETSKMISLYDKYETLLTPYAAKEITEFSFLNNGNISSAISTLKTQVAERKTVVEQYASQ